MPPLPKDPARRQRRNKTGVGVVVGVVALAAPAASKEWLAVTRDAWLAVWRAPLAGVVVASDVPALRRLFDLRDTRERYSRAVRRRPLVAGSTGQPSAHPFAKLLPAIDAEVRQLEDRFAGNPLARLKLGLLVTEARRTLDDLNREAEADGGDDDPRFKVLDVEARRDDA